MSTNLQEAFDAYFIKLPAVDFTGKEDIVLQLFKTAVGYASSTLANLDFTVDEVTYEGSFTRVLHQREIELIALYMVREQHYRIYSGFIWKKQQIGTKDFDKLPDLKKQFEIAENTYRDADEKVNDFKQEFNNYVS